MKTLSVRFLIVLACLLTACNDKGNNSQTELRNDSTESDMSEQSGDPPDSTTAPDTDTEPPAEVGTETDTKAETDTGIVPDSETFVESETDSLSDGQIDTDTNSLCGNGVLDEGEACDDGVLAGGYGECAPGCVLGPRCGDCIVQPEFEECEGVIGLCENCRNNLIYFFCGNGVLDEGETCDDGLLLDDYGGCAPGCVPGPHCGDGVVQSEFEQCDDGPANGTSCCSEQCVELASIPCGEPVCGNGVVDEGEQCDDSTLTGSYGKCAPGCEFGPRCGDGIVQPDFEQCDDGSSNGTGTCSTRCTASLPTSCPESRCGDGIRDINEECDDGVLAGEYGGCAAGCVLAPRCGDGILNSTSEACDAGRYNGRDSCCSEQCQLMMSGDCAL